MSFRRNISGRETGVTFSGDSLTEQHHARNCDINALYNRLVGGDTTVLKTGGVYADISEMPASLQGVLNQQITGRRAYESMPEAVRQRFPNAEEFYRAVQDGNSRKTFEELGLIRKEEKADPVKVEVVNNNSQVADPKAPTA